MSAREFAEWMAEYSIEPWGDERTDLQSALICLVLASAAGASGARIENFLPFRERDEEPAGPADINQWGAIYGNHRNPERRNEGSNGGLSKEGPTRSKGRRSVPRGRQ